LSPGNYQVEIIDDNGCWVIDSFLIELIREKRIFAPDAFSPNNDDIHDIYVLRGMGVNQVDFAIYDRLGELVFRSQSMYDGWDGRMKGLKMREGIYVLKYKGVFWDNSIFRGAHEIRLLTSER